MTDDEGRYAFTELAAGRYAISVSKTGHVGVTYGQTRPGRPGTPIQLTDGQKFAANLQLPRGSVITGTVVDEYGESTAGTQVRVHAVRHAGRPPYACSRRATAPPTIVASIASTVSSPATTSSRRCRAMPDPA